MRLRKGEVLRGQRGRDGRQGRRPPPARVAASLAGEGGNPTRRLEVLPLGVNNAQRCRGRHLLCCSCRHGPRRDERRLRASERTLSTWRRRRASRKRPAAATPARASALAHFRPASGPRRPGSAPRVVRRGPRAGQPPSGLLFAVPEDRSDFTRFNACAANTGDDLSSRR